MKDENEIERNMLNIGDKMFFFEVLCGIPYIEDYTVTQIKKVGHSSIEYTGVSDDDDNWCSHYETNVFRSIDEAVQVFNESQDDYILTRREK